jgi:hypothetical protein
MSTISPPPPTSLKRKADLRPRRAPSVLGRYTTARGDDREVLCCPGARGSVLVINCLTGSRADPLLVAHLAADEPARNAQIVASIYINEARGGGCRRLIKQDLQTAPPVAGQTPGVEGSDNAPTPALTELVDQYGNVFRSESVDSGMSIPELRWSHKTPDRTDTSSSAVPMREVIGALESYEPVRQMTARALEMHALDPTVSTSVLRVELGRVDASPIVLNRGLREAVWAAVARGLSMSEIAIRCGRVKRSSRGHISGETSWLARRIGARPEGGESLPTPWIHSDTLALIARQGLRLAPREVELG